MSKKIKARLRRSLKTKAILKKSARPRLVVFRSGQHIYAQLVVSHQKGDKVLVSSSSIDKEIKPTVKGTKVEQAYLVGKTLAERAKSQDIESVAFDRSGYKYHGRVKALADGAREAGLIF